MPARMSRATRTAAGHPLAVEAHRGEAQARTLEYRLHQVGAGGHAVSMELGGQLAPIGPMVVPDQSVRGVFRDHPSVDEPGVACRDHRRPRSMCRHRATRRSRVRRPARPDGTPCCSRCPSGRSTAGTTVGHPTGEPPAGGTPIEAEVGLEVALCRRRKRCGADSPRHHPDVGVGERDAQRRDPVRIGLTVVVDVGDDVARRLGETTVARRVSKPRTRLVDDPAPGRHDRGVHGGDGVVVDHQHLVVGVGEPGERLQATSQLGGPSLRAQHARDEAGIPGRTHRRTAANGQRIGSGVPRGHGGSSRSDESHTPGATAICAPARRARCCRTTSIPPLPIEEPDRAETGQVDGQVADLMVGPGHQRGSFETVERGTDPPRTRTGSPQPAAAPVVLAPRGPSGPSARAGKAAGSRQGDLVGKGVVDGDIRARRRSSPGRPRPPRSRRRTGRRAHPDRTRSYERGCGRRRPRVPVCWFP